CRPFAVSCTASRIVLFVICHYLDQFFSAKRFLDSRIAVTEQFGCQSSQRLQLSNGLDSSGLTTW
ncbi:MAG: hypothetical protein WBM67_06375, partial [Sedimenticolaceae bacterium]